MSRRSNFKQIQGITHTVHNRFERLQDVILVKTGISCSVFVSETEVSIRSLNPKPEEWYSDFIMAKSAISGITSLKIVQNKPDNA